MRNVVQLCLAAIIFCSWVNETTLFSFLQSLLLENGTSPRSLPKDIQKNKLGDPMIMICLPLTIQDILLNLLQSLLIIIFVGTATHWEDKVASISKEGVKPGNTLVSQLQLPVPSLPQTMQSCSCMKTSYLLRVTYSLSVHGDLWEKSSLCDVLREQSLASNLSQHLRCCKKPGFELRE